MQYQISKGTKTFGVQDIFENISFEIKNSEKVAIVGRNGCGKTTLLKIIAGLEELDSGSIHTPNGTRIGYLAQTTFDDDNITVKEALDSVFDNIKLLQKDLDKLTTLMETDHSDELLNKYATLQEKFEAMGGYSYEQEMLQVSSRFGFNSNDLERKIGTFSGGQKTRLAFVKLLLSKPDILLLDEPTNHLDIETINWLEGYIKNYPKAVILVSHDRMFMDSIAQIIFELEFNKLNRYVGNYTNYTVEKKAELERNKSAYITQQKEIEHLENLIEKFRYKATKASFAQSKIKFLDKIERIEDPKANEKTFRARFVPRISGGRRVLEADNLTIGYDKPLCNISFEVLQGQKIAILGGNGQGKSTLMKTLMKQIPALGGEFELGHQIEIGYFDQELAQFTSNNTVLEEIWNEYPNLDRTQVRTALGCFLFSNEDVFKPVEALSGGEKVRLYFTKLMLQQPNLLLLDEPTNHLDILGKEALESSLKEYEGTMIFVSHDRYFIKSLATSIIVIDDGVAAFYPMNYEDYMNKDLAAPPTKKQEIKKETVTPNKKYVNYEREISKLEKQIEEKEVEIEALRELRFDPEYYHDYKKMNILNDQIDDLNNVIENYMKLWTEYSEQI
ncbi:MAG: ABC-F type ribosomal protection protein [Erysipelotrichaceae bacterium]